METTLAAVELLGRRLTPIPPGEIGPLWTVDGVGDVLPALAVARAAGGLVERAALEPGAAIPRVPADDPARVWVGAFDAARAHPSIDFTAVDCVPGRSMRADGSWVDVLVPAAVIDHAASARARVDLASPVRVRVDPGRSGAASGRSFAAAAAGALLESVERDAAQAAWVLRPRLPALDPAAVPEPSADWPTDPDDPDRAAERLLADVLRDLDAVVRTVLVPTDLPGVTVAVTLAVEGARGGAVGAGSAAGWNARRAVRESAREAVEVLLTRRGLAGSDASAAPPRITCAGSRARYWASEAGVRTARRWLADCAVTLRAPRPVRLGAADPTLQGLLAGIFAAGVDPVLCDLTARLPDEVRLRGWHAVRAVPLGHQILRVDETLPYTWARGRLRRHARRWGTRVLRDLGEQPPHPFR
ncbi:hypothetical protein Val02_45000 [Virgisporangium aliadipatigenens]|uniref:YcaO domain-containing protein n=1 Tax=Virgisporangium aliadipatigenens TaxID=741659 RepID=A0A8J3YLG4_9ACTN|nr:YcaO-like family protein [Virgisporangium aliadipatigenens]GIJ47614.1 hypothetical protein Val02_45000 [Virgisporangium aliadipatigenens]